MKRYLIPIALILALTVVWATDNRAQHSSSHTTFRCPPCGCIEDHKIFGKAGKCPACVMPLVEDVSGVAKDLDDQIAPYLRGGTLIKIYPKLLYPVFLLGIVSALLLMVKRNKGYPFNRFLPGIILVVSLYGFKYQLFGVPYSLTTQSGSLFTPISMIACLGPLCYFLVLSLMERNKNFQISDYLHFIPAALILIYQLSLFVAPKEFSDEFMISPFEPFLSHFEQIVAVSSGLIYLGFSVAYFQKAGKKPDFRKHDPGSFLIRFFVGMFVFFGFWALMIFVNFRLYNLGVATVTYNPLWIAMTIVLVWLAIEIVRSPELFKVHPANGNGYVFMPQDLEDYRSRLENIMKIQKLYADPHLTLERLASALNMTPKHLSSALNQVLGKGFYEVVNEYRIEEAKKLLKDPENQKLTIEAIGNLSGFKSKSSFNAAFKKLTSMTPREYLKESPLNVLDRFAARQ